MKIVGQLNWKQNRFRLTSEENLERLTNEFHFAHETRQLLFQVGKK